MIHLDTLVLGAMFFREPGAAALLARLESVRKAVLLISAWSLTEMFSVAGIKRRTGLLDVETCQEALRNFQRFASTHLRITEVEPADFRTAAVLIETPAVRSALHAGDALHLAIAPACRRAWPALTGVCVQLPTRWDCPDSSWCNRGSEREVDAPAPVRACRTGLRRSRHTRVRAGDPKAT